MSVTSAIGTVGYACEPFQCLPHQTLGSPGESLKVEVYGRGDSPYILFLGTPVAACQTVPSVLGELAVWAPITLLEFGLVWNTGGVWNNGSVVPCGVDQLRTQFLIPTNAPLGLQMRLQAIALAPTDVGMGFTRAVEVHIR